MSQIDRTLQEAMTSLSPDEVLAAAQRFFVSRSPIYAAFIDMQGPNWLSLRGQGGEEIALAAIPRDGATLVTGSSYMFDAQVARFLSTLPPATQLPEQTLPFALPGSETVSV